MTNRESGTVLRVDPRTNRVVKTIRLPDALSPRAVAAREGQVWFSVRFCATGPWI